MKTKQRRVRERGKWKVRVLYQAADPELHRIFANLTKFREAVLDDAMSIDWDGIQLYLERAP